MLLRVLADGVPIDCGGVADGLTGCYGKLPAIGIAAVATIAAAAVVGHAALSLLLPQLFNRLAGVPTTTDPVVATGMAGPVLQGRYLFHSDADPLRIHGAAWQTHPAEVARLTEEARAAGVEINLRDGIGMAYGPAPTAGSPGVMVLDREASYGAWLHEFRHMRDDREAGWLGMRGWFSDAEVRAGSEIRAYDVEIQYAEQIGDTASAERLRLLRDEEVRMIMEGDR